MKMIASLSLFAVLLLSTMASAQCPSGCLFYGGDFDPNNTNADGLANENDAIVGGDPYGAATYQNFIVGGQGWNITGLFTNNLSGYTPTSGYWEVREGVSFDNGGTLVASGTNGVTNTPTGRSAFGYSEYHNEVDGLSINLSPGMYWEAVVPVCTTCEARSFNTNTFGLNSVGTQISDQQYLNVPAYSELYFINADDEGVFPTFSSGVLGTAVPEPSSLMMLGSGLAALVVAIRRRVRT